MTCGTCRKRTDNEQNQSETAHNRQNEDDQQAQDANPKRNGDMRAVRRSLIGLPFEIDVFEFEGIVDLLDGNAYRIVQTSAEDARAGQRQNEGQERRERTASTAA